MNFFHELLFDVIIEGLNKLSDKLRKNRPQHAKNGTLGEWIVCICFGAAVTAYIVLQILYAREDGNERVYYALLAVLLITGVLVAMVLMRHYLRWRKKHRDTENELL